MHCSFLIFRTGLASFDSILLLTSILLFVVPSIYTYSGVGEFYYRHIHPLITPYTFVLGTTAQTSSGKRSYSLSLFNWVNCNFVWNYFVVYLTLTVTVERYIAVCHPLRARAWCTCKRGRMAVIIIGIGSLLYNLPRFFEVERCLYLDNELGESWIIVNIKILWKKSMRFIVNLLFSSSLQICEMIKLTSPATSWPSISSSWILFHLLHWQY